jgi:phenylpyruvate tautomerase PptA (4-oxalocrotonate tautomerase family)
MPLVKIDIIEGHSQPYKSALLEGVHRALVTAFKIPEEDRNQRLNELPEINFEKRRERSKDFTIIEIIVFKGRSLEAKKGLYAEIAKNLAANPGIAGDDIIVVLNEQPLENWGVHGGQAASEVDLGFKVNV